MQVIQQKLKQSSSLDVRHCAATAQIAYKSSAKGMILNRVLLVFFLVGASNYSFAINKCISPDGKTSYQEAPCRMGESKKISVSGIEAGEKNAKQSFNPTDAPAVTEEALKEKVLAALKDGDSAKFKDLRYVSERALCGQVNAKNSYGGYTGFRLFVADFEGVYWSGDGSAQVDIGKPEARRTYVPKAHLWGCL